MDELTIDFKNSIFSNSYEVVEDYLEIGIDSFIIDGILKEVPVVKTLVTAFKVGKNLHDRNLLKNTLLFINEFNIGCIDKEKVDEYKAEIENNPKKCEEELGRVLLLLNRFIDKEKSIILSKLYKAYIYKRIDWNLFCEYSDIVDRLFISDLKILKKIKNEDIDVMSTREDVFRVERLYSLGLIGISWTRELTWEELGSGHINSVRTISELGIKFCNIILSEEE